MRNFPLLHISLCCILLISLFGSSNGPFKFTICNSNCVLSNLDVSVLCIDQSDYTLEISFDVNNPGISNTYIIEVDNLIFGPFTYSNSISQQQTLGPFTPSNDKVSVKVRDSEAINLSTLVINEVLYDVPPGLPGDANMDGIRHSTQDEFVEILNYTGLAIDIGGWTIHDAIGLRHQFPDSTILEANSGIVVFGGGSPNISEPNVTVQTASSGSLSLNNISSGGDQIKIYEDAIGTILHTDVSWQSGYTDSDESIQLWEEITGDSFVYHQDVSDSSTLFSPGSSVQGNSWTSNGLCHIGTIVQIPNCCYSRTVFRSLNSGSWSDPAIWEVSTNQNGPWEVACSPPGAHFANSVSIEPGHTVLFDDTSRIGGVVIRENGELVLGPVSCCIADISPHSDLLVLGTLTDDALSTQSLCFEAAATWELGPLGTIIKTKSSSSNVYRDNYWGGIENIPASATWVYRYTGGFSFPSITSANMVYPNLVFENSGISELYEPLTGAGYFQGGAGPTRVKGSLDIGGAEGIGGYAVRNCNYSAEPLLVEGDILVRSGSILTNELPPCCTNVSSLREGTGIILEGDVEVELGGELRILKSDYTSLKENTNERVFAFAGSKNQIVSGDGHFQTVHIKLDKTQNKVFLQRHLDIDSLLTLNWGKINGQDHQLSLKNSDPASLIGPLTDNSYLFNGSFIQSVQPGNNYTLPVGSESHLQSFVINFKEANISEILVQFKSGDPGYLPITEEKISYGNLLDHGFWTLDEPSGSPVFEGLYDVTLSAKGYSNYGHPCSALKTEDETWVNNPSGEAGPAKCTLIDNNVLAKRDSIETFSRFGIGVNGVLPLRFISLLLNKSEKGIELSWEFDADEREPGLFEVLRSGDGFNFDTIYRTARNPFELYSFLGFTDTNPLEGLSYYYVRYINDAGHVFNSVLRSTTFQSRSVFDFYPNPVSESLFIKSNDPINPAGIYIMPASGDNLHFIDAIQVGSSVWKIDIHFFPPGIYFLKVGGEVFRFVKA